MITRNHHDHNGNMDLGILSCVIMLEPEKIDNIKDTYI